MIYYGSIVEVKEERARVKVREKKMGVRVRDARDGDGWRFRRSCLVWFSSAIEGEEDE